MTRWASSGDVASAAENWTEGQVACRSLTGHRWTSHTVVEHPKARLLTVVQTCRGCKNKRTRDMSATTGRWIDNKWSTHYQPGYLLKGVGRIGEDGKSILRLTAVKSLKRRVVDDDA